MIAFLIMLLNLYLIILQYINKPDRDINNINSEKPIPIWKNILK